METKDKDVTGPQRPPVDIYASIGRFVSEMFFVIGVVVIRGFVIQQLWQWFVSTPYGLPALSIPVAIGFAILIRFVVGDQASPEVVGNLFKRLGTSLALSVVALVLGWVTQLFM